MAGTIERYWQWWIGELSGFVPAFLWKLRGADGKTRELQIGGTHVGASSAATSDGRARLVVAREDALVRTVTLPPLQGRDIENAVRLKLEQLFPLREEDVYLALGSTVETSGGVAVETGIVERRLVDDWLGEMVRQGTEIVAVTIENGGTTLELIDILRERRKRRQRTFLVAAALCLVGTAVVLYGWHSQRQNHIAYLEQEVQQVRERAVVASREEGAQNERVAQMAWLARKASEASAGEVLNALAATLPDDAWVEHLRLDRPRLSVSGKAADAVRLPALLNEDPHFKEARLQNARADGALQRFDLTLKTRERR